MAKFTVSFDTNKHGPFYEAIWWLVTEAGPYTMERSVLTLLDCDRLDLPDYLGAHWVEAYEIMEKHIDAGFAEIQEMHDKHWKTE